MSNILFVEDDSSVQILLLDFIEGTGYSTVLASNGMEAFARFSEQHFDLILLGIKLLKIDSYGVCEIIRQKSNALIIMLTALDSEAKQINGLDMLADDCITKPFSMSVLLRKIAQSCPEKSEECRAVQDEIESLYKKYP